MAEYRHTETGEVKTQGQWRQHYKGTSLPRTWKAATLASLKLEPVFETPRPDAGQYQTATRTGVEQDAKGNWVQAWAVRDMFSDTTAEDGTVTTKAEHEAAYQAGLDEAAAKAVRSKRDDLLAATDYLALSDTTLTPEMAAYRQALRDITDHVNFPYLDEADWPTKP